jgi:hypothetical protein
MGVWFRVGGIVEDVWGVVDADGRAVGASGTEKGPGGRFVRGGRGGSFGSDGRAGKVHARQAWIVMIWEHVMGGCRYVTMGMDVRKKSRDIGKSMFRI